MAEDWEWNYHPREGFYRRSKQRLTLKAFKPLHDDDLLKAGNTFTLRSWQTPCNEAVVCLDLSKMAEGQRSGICHFASSWSEFGIKMKDGQRLLYHRTNQGDERLLSFAVPVRLWLRSTWGLDAQCHYAYSLDGKHWHDMGALYMLQWGNYRGDRLGLYTYNNIEEAGEATFTHFTYEVR